jgi:hypothetical protein
MLAFFIFVVVGSGEHLDCYLRDAHNPSSAALFQMIRTASSGPIF